jgi:hypothetical protein
MEEPFFRFPSRISLIVMRRLSVLLKVNWSSESSCSGFSSILTAGPALLSADASSLMMTRALFVNPFRVASTDPE